VPNHLLAGADDPLPKNLQPFAAQLARRSMIVKKAKPLAIECIVRGYLSGSGWKEYKQSQTVCGIQLPAGLTESAELPEPIFTPSPRPRPVMTKTSRSNRRKKSLAATWRHRRAT